MRKTDLTNSHSNFLREMTVLFVEDEEVVRSSMERILKRRVKEIYVASDGKEGLIIFRDKNPDIIITDIRMPQLNGLDMIREIRKTSNTPIIITSGHNDEEFLLEAIELNVDYYLKKPIDQNKLISAMEKTAILHSERKSIDRGNRLIQTIMDVIPSLLLITDGEEITKLNKTFLDFLGFSSYIEYKKSGKTIDDFLVAKDDDFYEKKKFADWFGEIVQHPDLDFTMYLSGANDPEDETHTFLVHVTVMPDTGFYLLSFTDITLLETIKSLYHELSMKDSMTRIYNRKKFLDMLLSEIQRSTRYQHPLSLIMFDIDFFKRINDTYGHQTGDKAILQIVKLVRQSIRATDVFGRYGGEEFILCLPETPIAEAALIAERLRVKIAQLDIDNIGTLTCSFGVTHLIGNESVDELIKRADNALYYAKDNGRNRVEVYIKNTPDEIKKEADSKEIFQNIDGLCYNNDGEESPALCAIFNRRSIRRYRRECVPGEVIETLLRAAMAAPSAGNQQPWHFIVIDDRAILDQVPGIHPHSNMILEAPAAILVCGDPSLEKHQGYWVQDCSAAVENILIEVQTLGFGAVWLGVYPREDRVEGLRKLMGIPEHIIPFALIPIGYPAVYKPPADRYNKDRVFSNKWGKIR